ncbi:MAG: 6-phosphofructokinase [Deltaproteobacteria bacterium]|nr:6-phosphofructokinase [Deltaproteobacteria bacterium]
MENRAVAIVVGGGPAPGINGVISAATIEAINRGHKVYGIMHGFSEIMQGNNHNVRELQISDVSRIPREGGSILCTSRANPTRNQEHLDNVVRVLTELNVGYLVTIGGDDTASSAKAVADAAGGRISVAHVPKTIDNDLPLPHGDCTFGYHTAREVGTIIVETLQTDAKATGKRWYMVIAMGRTAGHLALGIGVAAGAAVTLIPEEFHEKTIPLQKLTDLIVGSILKRLVAGKNFGVAVVAEGIVEKINPDTIPDISAVERDPHGHIRYAELAFGRMLRESVAKRLKQFNCSITVVDKDVGYELRCARPIAFDREYTQQLGYGAVEFLLNGGSHAMMSRQGRELVPIAFADIADPKTGRTRVRHVDVHTETYKVAGKYMIRLTKENLADDAFMLKLSQITLWDVDKLREELVDAVK